MQVQAFTFNPFQENTYIIYNERKHCWIIDPGMMMPTEEAGLQTFIDQNNLEVKGILNTHCHIDHILGVDFVVNTYKVPFWIHEQEIPILQNAANTARMFGFDYAGVNAPFHIFKQTELQLDDTLLQLLHVPGHSPGSVAFYNAQDNWVISGDTLFEQSIGRTDLLMGDYDTLIKSIRDKLFTLPASTTVYSGHGNPTNIGKEANSNPFLL